MSCVLPRLSLALILSKSLTHPPCYYKSFLATNDKETSRYQRQGVYFISNKVSYQKRIRAKQNPRVTGCLASALTV